MTARSSILTACVLAAAFPGVASASSDDDVASWRPDPGTLEITLTPGLYIPRLSGATSLDGGTRLGLQGDFGLNDLEPSLNVDLLIRNTDEWSLLVTGMHFETSHADTFSGFARFGDVLLSPGTPYEATFNLTTVSWEVSVPLWRPYRDEPMLDFRFSPVVALRYVRVEQSLEVPGGSDEGGGRWFGLLAGLEMDVEVFTGDRFGWLRRVTFNAAIAAGPAFGEGGTTMWQIRTGITFNVTEHFGVHLGYRLVELNLENGDYELDGGVQGLFAGATLRF